MRNPNDSGLTDALIAIRQFVEMAKEPPLLAEDGDQSIMVTWDSAKRFSYFIREDVTCLTVEIAFVKPSAVPK